MNIMNGTDPDVFGFLSADSREISIYPQFTKPHKLLQNFDFFLFVDNISIINLS